MCQRSEKDATLTAQLQFGSNFRYSIFTESTKTYIRIYSYKNRVDTSVS